MGIVRKAEVSLVGLPLVALILALLVSASCDDRADGDGDTNADADGDTDVDIDGEGDTDGEVDADPDAEADGEADEPDADEEADQDEAPFGDPLVWRTPDVNAVCGPTPAEPCTPGDLAWVASEYGSTVQRADAAAAEAAGLVYRLIALVEREGPSNIDVFVVDAAGAPLAGVPVAFTWPDAPEPSRPDEWYPRKVTTLTDGAGRAGFALGAGAYIPACGAGGPHAIWVSEQGSTAETTTPTDLADRLGMLGGTNHRHLDLLFQRRAVPGEASEPATCPLSSP